MKQQDKKRYDIGTVPHPRPRVISGTRISREAAVDDVVFRFSQQHTRFQRARRKTTHRILPNKSRLQMARDLCTGIRILRSYYFVIEFRCKAIIFTVAILCADLLYLYTIIIRGIMRPKSRRTSSSGSFPRAFAHRAIKRYNYH